MEERMKELATENPRYGYRRIGVWLQREQGKPVNEKRIRRVYRNAGLSLWRLRRKRIRRQAVAMVLLRKPNQEWAMDFVHDAASNG
jgi:putative transposase